ncbi:MAG: hypothetical protein COX77_01620 [Candidatus Komeilibacteria bacterium CG_4_10_14_0_2_um_filter_37_10]|uniref:GtrA/DPMS transmembrane domain-containing protein n=1 Tax=Candidatus Komeilibacteria bacterium CG_4_10_14_0_2_um_filter_37_10 TaxID=1974470 RepID=A0A2M7VFK4_9BACT|nr:MAG: hypothetical protein COX77_01620 [Candidatus Komeilibacteria bacterium CG_4_10_14_0_2_um_filter_37_10]PJA94206.1 MAG: hypothetical protein CO133_00330 [Candidatus Komeilibacteria bacterium CG_4_9_14_3_um_filter_37_5]
MPIKALYNKHLPFLQQATKFIVVGFVNTLVDYVLYYILTRKISFFTDHYLVANAISFFVAVVNSYFLNNYWTFSTQQSFRWRIFIQYVLIYIVGSLIVAELILFLAVDILNIYDLIGKALAVIIGFLWNFTILRRYIFKQ